MEIMKYLRNPRICVGVAVVGVPVLSGLARLLAGGDFIGGVKQVAESPQIGNLYLVTVMAGVALYYAMRRNNLPAIGANVETGSGR